jgi:FkbM family methyltransferase
MRDTRYKEWLRNLVWRAGYEIRKRERTVDGRRDRLLSYHDIDLLIDVGANVGQYASLVQRNGYHRRILSLEPLSGPYRQLEAAAASNPYWQTRRTAVGARSGTVTLNIAVGSVFSSILPTLAPARSASRETHIVGEEEVSLMTLDEIVGDDGDAVAVKVDVQGFERDVLEGASRTLQRAKLVELELSPRPLYEGQMLMGEAMSRMDSAGFVLALVENAWRVHDSGQSLQFNGVFARE